MHIESPETHYRYSITPLVDTPRGDPNQNEDVLLIYQKADGGVTAFIADGATGVGTVAQPYQKKMAAMVGVSEISGGRFASLIVQREIQKHLGNGSSLFPKQLLLEGAQALHDALQQCGVQSEHFTQVASTLGAIADLSPDGLLRWACVRADVSVLIVHADGTAEWHPVDHPLDTEEGKALSLALKHSPDDISRALIEDDDVQEFVNAVNRAGENDSTYGSINGADPKRIAPWIAEGESTVQSGDRVFLFTDGLLPEKPRRAYADAAAFLQEQQNQRSTVIQLLHQKGPQALLDFARKQQERDPTCTLFPRFKAVGDDATLVEIMVTE